MPNPIRIRAIQGLKEGDSFTYTRQFTKDETISFGDITRDYNPVHYDLRWADLKGFKGLVCHGLLVGSMICEFGGQVGWLAVYFGDTIHCAIKITKIEESGHAEAEAFFTNQDDEQVCYTHLTGRIPLTQERELLKQMINEDDPTNKLSNEKYTWE